MWMLDKLERCVIKIDQHYLQCYFLSWARVKALVDLIIVLDEAGSGSLWRSGW